MSKWEEIQVPPTSLLAQIITERGMLIASAWQPPELSCIGLRLYIKNPQTKKEECIDWHESKSEQFFVDCVRDACAKLTNNQGVSV